MKPQVSSDATISAIIGGVLLLGIAGSVGTAAAYYIFSAIASGGSSQDGAETMGGNQAALSGGVYRVPRLVRLKG